MRRAAENERSGIRQLTVKKRNSTAGIYRDTEGKRQGEQYPSELENIVIGPFFRYAASHPATVLNSGETGDLDLLAREMLLTMDREVVAP